MSEPISLHHSISEMENMLRSTFYRFNVGKLSRMACNETSKSEFVVERAYVSKEGVVETDYWD